MMEPKTEVILVGHILEKNITFKLYDAIKDLDADVVHCEISFTTLKEGVEERRPSTMRFYLVGPQECRDDAIKEIEKLAEEQDLGIDTINYEELWKRSA